MLQANIPQFHLLSFSIVHVHTETHIPFAVTSLPVFSLCQLASCCGGAYENARHPLAQAGVEK